MEIEVIYGQVVGKANHYQVADSGGMKHIIKDKVIRAYEKNFKRQCRIYRNRMIRCNFVLHLKCYMSSMRYDLDNAIKTILDCMQDCKVIENDNRCRGIVAEKFIDKDHPRVVFGIVADEPELFPMEG